MNQEKKKTVKCTNSVKTTCVYSGCIGGELICDYLGKLVLEEGVHQTTVISINPNNYKSGSLASSLSF